jgi:hypothetical protein
MTALPQIASVHESTVKAAASHAASATKPRKPRPRRKATTHHVTVDLRVWAKALELAGGKITRIKVVGPDEVIVLNHPQKGNRCAHPAT